MQNYQKLGLNKENQLWLDLLINNKDDEKIFKNQFYDELNPMDSVLKFKDFLLEKGKGQNLTSNEINEVVKSRDKFKLKEMLSKLFLEPISFKEIENYMDSTEFSADDLIKLHNRHLDLRFSSLIIGYKVLLMQDRRKELKK